MHYSSFAYIITVYVIDEASLPKVPQLRRELRNQVFYKSKSHFIRDMFAKTGQKTKTMPS